MYIYTYLSIYLSILNIYIHTNTHSVSSRTSAAAARACAAPCALTDSSDAPQSTNLYLSIYINTNLSRSMCVLTKYTHIHTQSFIHGVPAPPPREREPRRAPSQIHPTSPLPPQPLRSPLPHYQQHSQHRHQHRLHRHARRRRPRCFRARRWRLPRAWERGPSRFPEG